MGSEDERDCTDGWNYLQTLSIFDRCSSGAYDGETAFGIWLDVAEFCISRFTPQAKFHWLAVSPSTSLPIALLPLHMEGNGKVPKISHSICVCDNA